jgi:SAM-dependent methyltransferase
MRTEDFASSQENTEWADLPQHLDRLVPASSEAAYDRLVGYGFARRYVEGKTVADIGWEDVGYGAHLLAEKAAFVSAMSVSAEAVDIALKYYSAPNASYEKIYLTELPYPEGHFDVVVALRTIENLDQPEDLVREASRVLKQDGIFVVSVPDKQGNAEDRPRMGMYAPQFQEMLKKHFGHVRTYRQGAVAGGSIIPVSGDVSGACVESASLSPSAPRFGPERPTSRHIVAVCGGAEALENAEQPYLVLDRDRRVFDECADQAEDLDLLATEIQNMEKTEVQTFRAALWLRGSEIAYLRAQIRDQIRNSEARTRRSEAQVRSFEAQIQNLKQHIHEMENSTTWRMFEPYRRLRAWLGTMKKPAPGSTKGSDDH